jgi:carboxyl-terminal processing protease
MGNHGPVQDDRPDRSDGDPAALAEHALNLLMTRAYYADRVDWSTVRPQVMQAAAKGASLLWALRPVWRALGDRHSHLRPAGTWPITPDRTTDLPVGTRLPPDLGLLQLPGIATEHRSAAALAYVQAAWAALRRPATGWVLDLRGNGGGNVVPMLAAVGPLLGAGAWLCYRRCDGSELSYHYGAGEIRADEHRLLGAPDPPVDRPDLPVAALVDHSTASAAEGVLVALRGRERIRIFGTATAGRATGNAAFSMADGSTLMITTSIAVDRLGRAYATEIVPDESGGLPQARAWLAAGGPPP